ncbi:MAG: AbiV family abortive infection protein [Pseudomonadota bacterium]|nr:AbiV family abortive infection protein [Pseudomonadota bacterium]
MLTVDLLQRYSLAALQNAAELLEEAALLEAQGHQARAYFLAVASIEETGKAHLAFDARSRDLANSAVASKVRKSFEDHSSKITAAFTPWLLASSDIASSAKAAVQLMVHLKIGREPSMYTDVGEDGVTVQSPSTAVRPYAARDCIRLARDCHAHARRHIETKERTKTTRAQDQFFAMKPSVARQMLNTEDFWQFHIDRLKAGHNKFEESVILYHGQYYQRQVKYNLKPPDESDT